MNGRALVSVGLPVRNGARFVERALRSIRDQVYEPLEIVVSDNGSTDDTEAICRAAAAADPRVSYERVDRNHGAAWNFVRAFRRARGKYFKWAAHDDLCRPTFVSACVERLDRDSSAVLCYPRTLLIDSEDQPSGPFEDGLALSEATPDARLGRLLAHRGEYHPIFGVVRRDVLASTQVMGAYLGADIVTLAELAMRGRFAETPERLFLRRYHPGTSMLANPDPRDRAAWFDPAARARHPMPASRITFELFTAIRRAPLDAATRARCLTVVARSWAAPRWRDVGGELKQAARTRLVGVR